MNPPVPLVDQFALLIRSLGSNPTGRMLVRFMNASLELSYKGFRLASGDLARAQATLSSAVNSPASIGISVPFWPWSYEPTYAIGTRQYDTAIKLATAVIGNAAGDIGATKVKVEAVKELVKELVPTLPSAPDTLKALKWVGIGAAALGAVYLISNVKRIARDL